MINKIVETSISIIESTLTTTFEWLDSMLSDNKNKEYKADFMNESALLSHWDKGFCLTGTKNLSVKHSYQNALCIGGTGIGKSSVVLVPSLFSMKGSFVINDPSGELFTKTAGYLKQQGYEIKVLNFTKPESSSGYNPISRANSSSTIQKVASMLIENSLGGKKGDPFWNTQATALLTILISVLKTQEAQYQNLYNVRQLLNKLGSNPESVDLLFSKHADEVLFNEYKALIAYDDKVLSSIIATVKASLNLFNDEAVASVTAYDNIDLQDFRKRPTALYIQNSVADQKYYSVITSLFFEQFFSYIFSRFPEQNEQDIFLLIDEASSLKLPTLPLAVANVRKHRAGIMLLVQDFSQLTDQYGKHEADGIKSNCFAKLYFTGTSLETSKELEQILGKYQYEDKEKRTVVRSLMVSDEIRTMKENKALLICGYYKPIIARLHPYYKKFQYRKYSQIPAEINTNASVNKVSILPLNQQSDEQEEQ